MITERKRKYIWKVQCPKLIDRRKKEKENVKSRAERKFQRFNTQKNITEDRKEKKNGSMDIIN